LNNFPNVFFEKFNPEPNANRGEYFWKYLNESLGIRGGFKILLFVQSLFQFLWRCEFFIKLEIKFISGNIQAKGNFLFLHKPYASIQPPISFWCTVRLV